MAGLLADSVTKAVMTVNSKLQVDSCWCHWDDIMLSLRG